MSRSFLLASTAFMQVVLPGCGALTLDELESKGALEVRVESNAKAYAPNVPLKLKFFVDMINASGRTLSLEHLKIELQAFRQGSPDVIALRQSWTYRHSETLYLADGKKLTIPIVPERDAPGGSSTEFPLEILPAGEYGIVAVVNGSHASQPCLLRIARPDLLPPAGRT